MTVPAQVLVTGASGFLGSRLVTALSPHHAVFALSRTSQRSSTPVEQRSTAAERRLSQRSTPRNEASAASVETTVTSAPDPRPAPTTITADFTNPNDLTQLDDHEIDTVVHLAAVTGGSTLTDALRVNVAGTHTLLDYCIARGVRRFVLASSIAATGCLSPDFLPRRLPIDDDHECDAVDAYGFSKAMVEQLAFFLGRVEPELDVTLFRIGAVQPEDAPAPDARSLERMTIPFTQPGTIEVDDAVAGLVAAVDHPVGPGVRRVNLVGRSARSPIPTAATLRQILGDRADDLDLSHFDQPGRQHDSVFAVDRLAELYDCHPR